MEKGKSLQIPDVSFVNFPYIFFFFRMTVPGRSKHQFEESALTAGKQDFKQQNQNRNPSPQKNKPRRPASTPPSPRVTRSSETELAPYVTNTRPQASLVLPSCHRTGRQHRTLPHPRPGANRTGHSRGATPAPRREGKAAWRAGGQARAPPPSAGGGRLVRR